MPAILFEVKEGIAIIKFNRPESLNSVNQELANLLQQKLDVCENDNAVRCVYITGAGKGFCAGQDLSEVNKDQNAADNLKELYNPLVSKITSLNKPVIAAVNGVAAGAGANIALCCDVVVAAKSAYFIQSFSKIGLIPDTGGTFFLPRLTGWQKASALMMLADKISAADAERIGMLYKVFSDSTFARESLQIAATLASMPTKALAFIKQALKNSVNNSLQQQLKAEANFQQQAMQTNDFKEGVKAFVEKRKPYFTGN